MMAAMERHPADQGGPVTTEYRVQLEAFEGPLDLLLYLIRRAEVDITDIPIATIADQYLAHLAGIERIDIDTAGEFLVMAATLMEIKSRSLAPPAREGAVEGEEGATPPADDSAPDPRAELVRQLLAYKAYRDAADALDRHRREWERRHPAAPAGIDDERLRAALAEAGEGGGALDMEDLSLLDLAEAFASIMATVNLDRLGDHKVVDDDTPIELHAADLLDRLRRDAAEGPVSFGALLAGRSRAEMIGLFLAVLELVRQRRLAVRQESPGGAITLALRPDADAAPAPEPAP